ncbi:5-dehydro-2-deoxygluconokinase, partial [Clostridiales bacterium F-3ap]|nr:5-dehydro-2-deoxygluconokinase [Anaerotalea alkaliphila]NDL68786.1 5-dehydro-2-deoxygluconokinase [Anaerotalea alkaliphila]
MNKLVFQEGRELDLVATGRLAIDLNTVEVNIPMEETTAFKKY